MTWSDYHSKSERLASAASMAKNRSQSVQLYRRAAFFEIKALRTLPRQQQRTIGVTAVSALSLLLKGGKAQRASRVANVILREFPLPTFAMHQIKSIKDGQI